MAPTQPSPEAQAAAASEARKMILSLYGGLEDMPVKSRDTIAHTYFSFCVLKGEGDGGLSMAHFLHDAKGTISDAAYYISAIKFLPEMIRAYREEFVPRGADKADYLMEVLLLTYKYRVPEVRKKRLLFFPFYKWMYRRYARRIPSGFYGYLMRE